MAPTDEKILSEAHYQNCKPEHGGNWTQCSLESARYPTFNAWGYSLQLLAPFLDIRQTKEWAPTPMIAATTPFGGASPKQPGATPAIADAVGTKAVAEDAPARLVWSPLGQLVLFASWLEMSLGAAAAGLLAGVVAGLIRKGG